MRILCAAAVAVCFAGVAWADEAPRTPSRVAAEAAANVDADQIQRTMETIFEDAFAVREDNDAGAAPSVQAALEQRYAQGEAAGGSVLEN